MKIEFFSKQTGLEVPDTKDWLFVMNDKVYQDNFETTESQAAVVCFDDFIKERPDLDWRAVDNPK